MLLTIHNLPATTRYADIKSLLQSKCGLQHVILDNLITDGNGKKVTVGVAEDADAAILVRKINGLYWNGQQLYVEDVRQQKAASEQPFRATNTQLQETNDPSFRSMNLQQHSSFSNKTMGMPANMMTPAVHPMMAAMYYVPDYTNQEYMQSVNMQGNFMQGQNYEQVNQKVQNTYMGIGGFSQTATQMSQVGMVPQFNKDSQSGNQNPGWGENYNEEENFAAERPLLGRRSPENNRKPNWFSNQQRQRDSSPRERSAKCDQPWSAPRDIPGPRPTQPAFRPNRLDDRSGFKKPRPDFRPDDRSALLEKPIHPEFRPNAKGQNQFTGRPNAFSGRPNQRQERPNDRESREFGRPNEYQGPNEYSGPLNERQGRPNEFSDRKGRSNDRPGFDRPNEREEFSRSNVRDEPMRSNDRFEISRRGPNQRDVRPERDPRPDRDSRPVRGNSRPEVPDSRKRKFDEGFQEKPFERPSRISRPNLRPHAPGPSNKRPASNDSYPSMLEQRIGSMDEVEKEKYSKRMFLAGVRKIIYEIKTNLSIQDPDLITRQALNKFVNDRLEWLLGGKKMVTPMDCFGVYRSTYPVSDDKAAYNEILAIVAQRKANEALGVQPVVAAVPPRVPKPALIPKKSFPPNPSLTKGERKAQKMFKEAKQLLSQGRVPTFPLGSKQIVAQQKKEDKEGYIPEVKGPYKPAVTEEVKALTDLFIKELDNAPNENVQKVYDSVNRDALIDEITHKITQTLSRRILDCGLKVVRIYGCPKLPKREMIEKFLLKFGVQSLRKSVKSKMYTAAVDTYRNHDRLCATQSVILSDGNTLSFKPFHVAPKPRADQKTLREIRKKILRDMVDKTTLNLLDKDWPAKEAEIKQKQETEDTKALERQVLQAQKRAEEAEKKSIEAQKSAEEAEKESPEAQKDAINDEKNSTDNEPSKNVSNENLTDNEPSKNVSNEYLHSDFHVIDEVHENDSDVDLIESNVVLDEGNNDRKTSVANDSETNVEGHNDENDDGNDGVDAVNDSYDVENEVEATNDIDFSNDVEDNFDDHDFEENDVELAYKAFEKIHSAAAEVDIDNIDVDIDDVDDDDLEDY